MATTITRKQFKKVLDKMTANSMTITRNPKLIREFLAARAQMNSAKEKMEKLRAKLDLPAPSPTFEGVYVITDRNRQVAAKYTVFHRDGFEVQAGWIGKVS